MNTIMEYLTGALGLNTVLAERYYKQITKYDDIKAEFEACIANDRFPDEGLTIEGFAVKDIAEMAPFMNYLGVYNFMVSLRDEPEKAKRAISEGFKIK